VARAEVIDCNQETAAAIPPRGQRKLLNVHPLGLENLQHHPARIESRFEDYGRQRLLITRLDEGGRRDVQEEPAVERQALAGVREMEMVGQ
jgi:hypothetical protein